MSGRAALTHGFAGLCSLALALLLSIVRPGPLPAADWLLYDALLRTDGRATAQGRTAIVAIDESSLARVGQWPWSREVLARLVVRLREMGASAIAFDALFAEPGRAEAAGDTQLAAALAEAPAVLGHGFVFDGAPSPAPCVLHPVQLVERQRGEEPPRAGLFEATRGICALPALGSAAPASGFINVTPDPDGLLRRVPLLVRYEGAVYPSLPLAAVRLALGGGPVVLDARADGSLALTVGRRSVGLDARGRMLVRPPSMLSHELIPAIDILEQRASAGRVRGRVVFVGATALGLRDSVSTATARGVPGVLVHAVAAETLLGAPAVERSELAPLAEVGAALAFALVVSLGAARYGLLTAALLLALTAGATWLGVQVLLARTGAYVSPLWGWMAGATALLVHGTISLWSERRRANLERRRRADAQRLIVQALTTLTETRDVETGRHARRTQELTRLLATVLARRPPYRTTLDPHRIALISTLAPLHDIGKVGVSDAVLRKPGVLTADERDEMRRHPGLGYDSLLKAEALAGVHDDEVLAVAKDIVYTHHERWDGSGYPRGVRGAAIPVSGRLVALVDTYDAMVSPRTYSAGMSHDAAVAAIARERGRHFDPDIVDAFLDVHEQFRAVAPVAAEIADVRPAG